MHLTTEYSLQCNLLTKNKIMTTEEIIKNLTELNEWRRGGEGEMPDPKLIGITIDEAINKLKPKESKEDLRNRIYFEMRNGKQTNKMKTKRL